jgi:hypothetical protein
MTWNLSVWSSMIFFNGDLCFQLDFHNMSSTSMMSASSPSVMDVSSWLYFKPQQEQPTPKPGEHLLSMFMVTLGGNCAGIINLLPGRKYFKANAVFITLRIQFQLPQVPVVNCEMCINFKSNILICFSAHGKQQAEAKASKVQPWNNML